MKKTIEIILITIAILFWIFAPLLIVLLPEIKTSYKDIVLNWSDVGEILDKFVQIMSAALIPILIFYFGREDANRKDLEIENLKLKKEEKYHEEAKELTAGIQKAIALTCEQLKNQILHLKKEHADQNLNNQLEIYIDYRISYSTFNEKIKYCIVDIFSEKEKRTLVNKILTKMNILREDYGNYVFFINSLTESYKTEWSSAFGSDKISFCKVLEKLAEEFDSDLHLERVIEILKDLDE